MVLLGINICENVDYEIDKIIYDKLINDFQRDERYIPGNSLVIIKSYNFSNIKKVFGITTNLSHFQIFYNDVLFQLNDIDDFYCVIQPVPCNQCVLNNLSTFLSEQTYNENFNLEHV